MRVGDHVLRPSNAHTVTIHRFLRALGEAGFDGASVPVGVDPGGRERLRFIEGDVAISPLPEWVQTDAALASIARLMRRFHAASARYRPSEDDTWSDELADPNGGSLVCHNDVCLENVVFRGGEAIALLDFDFAAPGSPLYDLAACARMNVPIDDPESCRRGRWSAADLPARLRLFADAYGLDTAERAVLLDELSASIGRRGRFVRRRVEAGDPNFIAMWEAMGGSVRFERRYEWWLAARVSFVAAM